MPTQKQTNTPIVESKTSEITYHPNDLVLNKYRIINKLGAGGMSSIVYKAEDTTIKDNEFLTNKEKFVAIKVVNRDANWSDADWTKIHDECVTSQRVTNKKNIVNTYEISKVNNGNTIIIVMEYIDGISLHDHLEKIGNFNIKEAVYYFQHIIEAIKELHSFSEKIIHRDLKPENIMLTKDLMNVKIIDFGISSVIIEFTLTNDKKAITNEESLFGTYPYISPDLLKMNSKSSTANQQIISEQFDFFSLGVIFYEMLMGEKPFKITDENDKNVIKLPLTYDMMCISDINPTIPAYIENIIFRCLASKNSDIKYRYHSINEIINDLNAYSLDPEKSAFVKLLKPKKERTLQLSNTFNVQAQILKERFYEKAWFYWLLFGVAAIIVIIVVVLVSMHIITL